MRWLQTEYILKGIFLGLLLDIALRQAGAPSLDPQAPLLFAGCAFGGLLVSLFVAALFKMRQGYRAGGKVVPFILFLLLENPTLVYIGVLGGTVLASFLLRAGEGDSLTLQMVAGGAALGMVFNVLRQLRNQRMRLLLSLVLGAGLVAAAVYVFGLAEGVEPRFTIKNYTAVAVFSLVGLPIFYLLTFAGQEEETEIEVGALCATLGFGLATLAQEPTFKFLQTLAFLLPIMLYVWYTLYVLPGLRVFKYVLRGMSHAAVGRYRPALIAFRRALQLDPRNKTAREEFWGVHIKLDPEQLERDPQLLALVDFRLCIERAGTLLMTRPDETRMSEANRLLDLVEGQKPGLRPSVTYWRAVARIHEGRLDDAATLLEGLLDPARHPPGDRNRLAILYPAWQLVLMVHDELRRRVGLPQLVQPGRRMEAIAAVEIHLAENPEDQSAWPLKRLLYQDLKEEEFEAVCGEGRGGAPEAFDYAYTQEFGGALVGDPARWERGCSYLRIASVGMPMLAPTILVQIADVYAKAGNKAEQMRHLGMAKRAGLAVGFKNLADPERHTFFRAVKALGDEAITRGDLDAALDDFHLYAEYERSGLETLRTLAMLYQEKGDILAALRITDQALIYDPKDKDLLDRKAMYYHSLDPAVLAANLEAAGPGFDVEYCLRTARSVLDGANADLESLEWAEQLLKLVLVVKPEHRPGRVLLARVHRRRGEVEEAAKLLESVRTPKPEKFATNEDEEAWYDSCRTLGDIYVNDLSKPELAVPCLNDYRRSPKSGAMTYYRMGQAYEMLGDTERAARCYRQVTAYESNPLAGDAHEALSRMGRTE